MLIELAVFTQLAKTCAPHVAVETLASVARLESSFNEFAIHDNTTRRSYRPTTREEAIGLATELVTINGHSVDLGIMQINAANLPGLKMTIADAFDICHSQAAAERVLVGFYSAPVPGGDEQAALRQALSRYNTGDPVRGIANGYVQRVQASAEIIVPAIRLRGDVEAGGSSHVSREIAPSAPTPAPVQALPPLPADWDVYGQARASRSESSAVVHPDQPFRSRTAAQLTSASGLAETEAAVQRSNSSRASAENAAMPQTGSTLALAGNNPVQLRSLSFPDTVGATR